MKRILLIGLFSLSVQQMYAQSCAQKLSKLERDYEEGKLLDIPSEIQNLLNGKSSCVLTKEESIRAKALLTKTYIFMDEEGKADDAMQDLLKTDPEHILDKQTDPREFFFLMDQFRTDPIFRIALRASLNIVNVNVITEHGTSSYDFGAGSPSDLPKFYNGKTSQGDDSFTLDRFEGDFNAVSGIATGFGVELMIERHLKKGVEIGLGFQYQLSQYNVDSYLTEGIVTSLTNRQSYIRTPILLRYTLWYDNHKHRFKPYGYAGASPNFLVSAKYLNGVRNGGTAYSLTTENDLVAFDMVNDFNLTVFGGVGVKIRIKTHYFTIEGRYDSALDNYINANNRFANQSSTFDAAFAEDNLSLNTISFSLGWAHSIYSPKKLKEFK